MRLVFVLFVFITVTLSKTPFHDGIVQEVQISMETWQWEALFVNRSSDYFDVRLEFPDKHKGHVGLMIENFSTADESCTHEGCRFKFDLLINAGKFTSEKSTIMGNKILHFNNNHKDPSMLRQTFASIAYQDMAVGVKTGLINLDVEIKNSTQVHHLGIYTVLQEVDKYFAMDNWPKSDTGDTYRIMYPSGDLQYRGDDFSGYPDSKLITNGHKSDGAPFLDFVTLLENATTIESYRNYTDIDEILGFIVVSSLLGCFDNAVGSGDNVFMYGYKNKTGDDVNVLMKMIGYDYSDAFGLANCSSSLSPQKVFEKDIFNPLCNEEQYEEFPLLSKFLQINDVKLRYMELYQQALDYTVRVGFIEDYLDYTLFNIKETVKKSENSNFYSFDDFLCAIERKNESNTTCRTDIQSIQKFLSQRRNSVEKQLKENGWVNPLRNTSSSITVSGTLIFLMLVMF